MTTTTAPDSTAILNNFIESQKQAAAANKAATQPSDTDTSISKVTGDFNTFLKILTTQLRNQNPESATDPNQFTQQLVAFSGIEQQINTNKKLDQLISSSSTNGITPLLSYVGKYIEAPANNQVAVQGGTAEFAYTLPSAAQNVKIIMKDSAGKIVANLSGLKDSGLNRAYWDGKDDNGNQLADGTYSITIAATDTAGKAMTGITDIRLIGQVTGIQTDGTGATNLSVGGITVKGSDVDAVYNTSSRPGAASS